MGSLFQRDGLWYYALLDEHGNWRKRSARTRDESAARSALHEAEKRVAMGLPLDPQKRRRGQMLKEFVAEYLTWRADNNLDVDRPRQALAHALAYFQSGRLNAITPEDIDAYVTSRRAKAKPDTIQREIVVIKAMFNKARKWKRIEDNPAAGVDVAGAGKPRGRQLTLDEIARLIKAARTLNPVLADLIEVAAQTACRLGELLRLRECDCNFDEDEIAIWETKTDEPRTVPLHNRAWEIVRSRCTDTAPDRRLFPIANVNRPFQKAVRTAGLHNVRFHDLRGAATSFLFETGADLPTVKAITGHKRADTILKHYARAQKKTILKAVRRLPTFREGGKHMGKGKLKTAKPAQRKRLPVG